MYCVVGDANFRTFRVLWALEELGVPYDHLPARPRSPEIRALNPSGKIPALVTGDAVLTDSSAILTWLADRHGRLGYTAGTVERAQHDALLFQILDEIEGPLWTAARHSYVLPENERVPAIKPSLRKEFAVALERIAGRLADRPFLTGDTLSVADIVLSHCGTWAGVAGFPAGPAVFRDYLARTTARPAYLKAKER